MDILCPKGHHSTDLEYCSECGAKIGDAPSGIAATAATAVATLPPQPAGGGPASRTDESVCPDCGTKRSNGTAVFCEICRYNFATHKSWTVPDITAAPAPIAARDPVTATATPPDPGNQVPQNAGRGATIPPDLAPASADATSTPAIPPAPVIASGSFFGWDAVLSVDASLYTEPDPSVPLPSDPTRTYPLDLVENLIGRRSDRRDIHPEINVNDAGVSHRHAKLLREPDGTFALLDVGSTNGTRLNGTAVEAGVRTPLSDGDEITLGYWTRIAIVGRRN